MSSKSVVYNSRLKYNNICKSHVKKFMLSWMLILLIDSKLSYNLILIGAIITTATTAAGN